MFSFQLIFKTFSLFSMYLEIIEKQMISQTIDLSNIDSLLLNA